MVSRKPNIAAYWVRIVQYRTGKYFDAELGLHIIFGLQGRRQTRTSARQCCPMAHLTPFDQTKGWKKSQPSCRTARGAERRCKSTKYRLIRAFPESSLLASPASVVQPRNAWRLTRSRDEMSFVLFLNDHVFDADMTRIMGQAFDAACKQVDGGGRPPELVKEVLAKRIIQLARTGERDPQSLCAKALEGSGIKHAMG
jgi:hypothetical protein